MVVLVSGSRAMSPAYDYNFIQFGRYQHQVPVPWRPEMCCGVDAIANHARTSEVLAIWLFFSVCVCVCVQPREMSRKCSQAIRSSWLFGLVVRFVVLFLQTWVDFLFGWQFVGSACCADANLCPQAAASRKHTHHNKYIYIYTHIHVLVQ